MKLEQNQSEEEYSFYTEDSYELLERNPDITMQSYKRPHYIPELNLLNLPDYISSSDEEEEDEGEDHQSDIEAADTKLKQSGVENNNSKDAVNDDML